MTASITEKTYSLKFYAGRSFSDRVAEVTIHREDVLNWLRLSAIINAEGLDCVERPDDRCRLNFDGEKFGDVSKDVDFKPSHLRAKIFGGFGGSVCFIGKHTHADEDWATAPLSLIDLLADFKLTEQNATPTLPRVEVTVSGGLVSAVDAEQACQVYVVDLDGDGGEQDEVISCHQFDRPSADETLTARLDGYAEQARVDAEVEAALQRASHIDDMESLAFGDELARIQALLGQTHGDVAGAYFSFPADVWRTASPDDRMTNLCEYVEAEMLSLKTS